jgi:hypothetical protein
MAHDDDEPGAEPRGGKLHAAHLGWSNDVAGYSNDEEIAEALIEDQLGGHSRIRAAQNDGEGLLSCDQRHAAGTARKSGGRSVTRNESTVSLPQARESFEGAQQSDSAVLQPAFCILHFAF